MQAPSMSTQPVTPFFGFIQPILKSFSSSYLRAISPHRRGSAPPSKREFQKDVA